MGPTAREARADPGAGTPAGRLPATPPRPGTDCPQCAILWLCRGASAAPWRRGGTEGSLEPGAAAAWSACRRAANARGGQGAAAGALVSGIDASLLSAVLAASSAAGACAFCAHGPAAPTRSGFVHLRLRARSPAGPAGARPHCWSRGAGLESRASPPTGGRGSGASACETTACEVCVAHGPALAPGNVCGRSTARRWRSRAKSQCLLPVPRQPAPLPPQRREGSGEVAPGRRPEPSRSGSTANQARQSEGRAIMADGRHSSSACCPRSQAQKNALNRVSRQRGDRPWHRAGRYCGGAGPCRIPPTSSSLPSPEESSSSSS